MNIAHLVEKIKGFPLKAKSFRNIATYRKPKGGGGGPSTPSPTLYHGGGMTLCVRPRVKTIKMTGEDTSCPWTVPKRLKLTWYNPMLLILKMTTAQVVGTSVTVNNNRPIQDYVHPDDQTQYTFDLSDLYIKKGNPYKSKPFSWGLFATCYTCLDYFPSHIFSLNLFL